MGNKLKSIVAYEKIRDLILSGKKLPGARLVAAELEEELQIGRGPIREALMRLDRSGLVRTLPYKGAVVFQAPSIEEIEYIYAMRLDLESMLARNAMSNISPETFEQLHNLLNKMKGTTNSSRSYYALDREFHQIIYEHANLPHLCFIVEKLMETLEVFLSRYQYRRDDYSELNAEHELILQCLEQADEALLDETVKRNITAGLDLILRFFRDEGQGG